MKFTRQQREDRVILEPQSAANAAIVWLHGLGADGNDFVPIVEELSLPASAAIRFIFPHAPYRAVTINGGVRMRAWYDILSLSLDGPEDEFGVRESASMASAWLIEQREAGIDSRRMILAGFSQGGAVALHAGLRHPDPLAGILALSTYLPLRWSWPAEAHEANRRTPVLMMHGRFDPVLPMALGEMSRDHLLEHGQPVQWRDYPMQHQVCLEQIRDIGRWIGERLGD